MPAGPSKKKKKSTEQIDSISALVNALPATRGASYDTRSPLVVDL